MMTIVNYLLPNQVNFNAIHNLIAKQSIIAPLVEGYVSTMMEIPCMLDGPVAERDFKVRALNFALKRIEDNVAIRRKWNEF